MKQLDPRSVWLFFINYSLRWAIALIFLIMYIFLFRYDRYDNYFMGGVSSRAYFEVPLLVLVLIPLFIAAVFVWAKLTYRFYRYELTDAGFRKESGVIYKKYVTIPYDRIQNVDIYRGILARMLGLPDLHIQTAGASAISSKYGSAMYAEGRLPGLSHEVAEQLRDELVRRARPPRNQGL